MKERAGLVLIGHGSLRSASGASMIRMAARLRTLDIAEVAEAGFLNFSRPSLAEVVARCVDQGVTSLIVQPYFLIDGTYVEEVLPEAVSAQAARFPHVKFALGRAFGDHPAMVRLVIRRLAAADPALGAGTQPSALLFMAHGSPDERANHPICRVATRVLAQTHYMERMVSYLECNEPHIAGALGRLEAQGYGRIVALPYFLQYGRHVREDLPAIMAAARLRNPKLDLVVTHHLDYDLELVEVIAHRVRDAQPLPNPWTADQGMTAGEWHRDLQAQADQPGEHKVN